MEAPEPAAAQRWWRGPVLALLLIAPVFGEVLSTATPPLDLLMPWTALLMVGMYGCGALLCRELAVRHRFGVAGLVLLGAAYGVYEEALVDRFWFDPEFWADVDVGNYSVVWHTNLLLAAHLTVFHTAVSVIGSIVVVHALFPSRRRQPWLGRRGLLLTTSSLVAVLVLFWPEFYVPPIEVLVAASALIAALIAASLLIGRRPAPGPSLRSRAWLGWIAAIATATHFFTVYAVPSTGLAWPLGLVLSLLPVGIGAALVQRWATGGIDGEDGLRVVVGIVSFFVVLDMVIGLGGRYDLSVAGLAIALILRRLLRRSRQAGAMAIR